jgi:hypothetical protein
MMFIILEPIRATAIYRSSAWPIGSNWPRFRLQVQDHAEPGDPAMLTADADKVYDRKCVETQMGSRRYGTACLGLVYYR